MNTPANFNKAYYAAQPWQIREAIKETAGDTPERRDRMAQISAAGLRVDRLIMIDDKDPYKTMYARHIFGYTWVESLAQAGTLIDSPPGYFRDGGRRYDPLNPPPGTILVPDPDTCDLAAWYPPFAPGPNPPPPLPPVPAPRGPYLGPVYPEMDAPAQKSGCRYCLPAGELLKDGYETSWGQPDHRVYIKARLGTFATIIHYFYPKAPARPDWYPPVRESASQI